MGEVETITLEGISSGMELGEVVYGPVQRDDFKAYADASGDDNPIHQDEDYARKTGAPTVFAMGMLPAGYLAHAVSDWFGGPQHLRRFKVRFTTRVWPDDEIVCTGKVQTIDGNIVTVTIEARRRGDGPPELELDHEQVALMGEADIELPL
ncbi:MAG: MaoC/PaaZ C-terminal domain-containing protein [Actinomycetota bacterium]